ncbi:MAG: glycoside hydrolase family 2, partial [Bacteroidetes bacterium]|nr:glycoside hydrolase family 2 [Fibrella sp.]
NQCTFRWKLKKFTGLKPADTTALTGILKAPNVAPQTKGMLTVPLPATWGQYDVLYVTARDPYGREIYTWSWPISLPQRVAERFMETGSGAITARDEANRLTLTASGLTVGWNKKTGMIEGLKNAKNAVSFGNGPVLIGGDDSLKTFRHRDTLGTHVVELLFEGKHRYRAVWTIYPSGWLKLTYQYRPDNTMDLLGITFAYPEEQVTGMDLLGNGPYRVWRNRLKGGTLDAWHKTYNDAVTGERWEYPEFKGYYSHVYGARLRTKEGGFTVLSGSEAMFLRVLTPTSPKAANNANTVPAFPSGGISFMHGIPAVGTKFQKPETMGPQSQPNMLYANGGTDTLSGVLYFDFR